MRAARALGPALDARRCRAVVALLLATAMVLGAACGEEVATQDIVSTIPWADRETARYVLREREGDGVELGRAELSAQREGDRYRLGLRFEDADSSDESTVVVLAESLKPVSLRRQITGPEGTSVVEGQYEDGVVRISARSDGRERSSPLRLREHHYDNDSSLFLWRTIPFAEGYSASYHTVIVNRRNQQVATVAVVGKEEVAVPAGTFDAWRVEIRSGGVEQVAWFADTPARPLVRYDNSELLFLLTDLPEEPAG